MSREKMERYEQLLAVVLAHLLNRIYLLYFSKIMIKSFMSTRVM